MFNNSRQIYVFICDAPRRHISNMCVRHGLGTNTISSISVSISVLFISLIMFIKSFVGNTCTGAQLICKITNGASV